MLVLLHSSQYWYCTANLPTRDTDIASNFIGALGGATRKKKGTLPSGWSKVTVQTTTVNQRKDLEVSGCQSLPELRERPQLTAFGVDTTEAGLQEDWHGGSRRTKK